MRGSPSARLRIDLFSDISAPGFGAAHAIAREIERRYAEVCVTYRPDVPPDRAIAWAAAETLYEVLKQCGNVAALRFLERVAATRRVLTQADLERYAEAVGARRAGLRHALRVGMHRPRVEADFDHARTQGVRGTATFVVDGRPLLAEMPLAIVFDIVDEALNPSSVDLELVDDIEPARRPRRNTGGAARFRQIVVQWTALRSAPVSLMRTKAEAAERARRLLGRARLPDADFEALAARFGDAGSGLAVLQADELPPQVRRRAVRLAPGEVSELVTSGEGFHVVMRLA